MSQLLTQSERAAATRTTEEQREFERRQVAEHYDNHPEIFQMFLDRRLGYATGMFLDASESLETAQDRKYAWIRDQLRIRPGDEVLDVGCGWGSNLLYLAQHTEGRFHGITLSPNQREFTLGRAREWGVADRVRVDVCHFGDMEVAPESLDAVLFCGCLMHMNDRQEIHHKVSHSLKPGGRLLISDTFFPEQVRGDRASRATHFVFARTLGFCRLLPLSEELAFIEKAGLDIELVLNLNDSYAWTVDRWIENIRRNRARINELSPNFARPLQAYITIGKLSLLRRTALEYMIVATKGRPWRNVSVNPLGQVPA